MTLSEDDFEQLHETLLRHSALLKGKPLWDQMDLILAGRVGTGIKILAFALEVNYGDFFAALSATAAQYQGSKKLEAQAA
jgi:hypothetical protein